MRPNDLIWPYVVNNYYLGKQAPPFDLLFWNSDSTNLPGRMFAEYLRQTYLENQIASAKARMCDTDVRLKTVKAPTYVVACEKDHIVPWQASYVGSKLLGGKVRFVLAAGGHIAGIVNPPAGRQRMALDGTRKKRTFGNGGEVAGDCKKIGRQLVG